VFACDELLCPSLARTLVCRGYLTGNPLFQEAVPNAGYSACHHKITNTDTLIIELHEPDHEPATTWIIWQHSQLSQNPSG
jgi:hypothetical protein